MAPQPHMMWRVWLASLHSCLLELLLFVPRQTPGRLLPSPCGSSMLGASTRERNHSEERKSSPQRPGKLAVENRAVLLKKGDHFHHMPQSEKRFFRLFCCCSNLWEGERVLDRAGRQSSAPEVYQNIRSSPLLFAPQGGQAAPAADFHHQHEAFPLF